MNMNNGNENMNRGLLNRGLYLVFFLLLSGYLSAQDRYMVFFRDKANSIYSASEPLKFLSQRALDRRSKHSVEISEEDFPVNMPYVEAINSAGAQVYFTSRWMNAALVEMLPTLEPAILGLPFVQSIEFVAPGSKLSFDKDDFFIAGTFNNPATISGTSQIQVEMLGADKMHEDGFDGQGVLIAIFDGGFSGAQHNAPFQHLHNENRIMAQLDFVENSGNPYQYGDHGTLVLSCISGIYEDIFVGTAPGADIILAVTEEVATEYRVEEYNWLFAAEYADSAGADVINSSLGYTTFDDANMNYNYDSLDGQTTVITRAANLAANKGVLVVNSAGNAGNSLWNFIGAPADSPNVLAVGAVDANKEIAIFSSLGPSFDGRTKPDVSAMGVNTVVVNSSGNIVPSSGTSFSSPLMAGFSASLIQAYPDLTNMEIMALIRSSGDNAGNPDNQLGYGIPSYLVILDTSENLTNSFNVYPNPMSLRLNVERIGDQPVSYQLVDLDGKIQINGELQIGEDQIYVSPSIESGVYFLQLRSGDRLETIKLLKK